MVAVRGVKFPYVPLGVAAVANPASLSSSPTKPSVAGAVVASVTRRGERDRKKLFRKRYRRAFFVIVMGAKLLSS